MAQEQDQSQSQIAFLLSDFNTRLRDLEERNRIIKERVLLLGQNLISFKESLDTEIEELKKTTSLIRKDQEKIKSVLNNLLDETSKFVKTDEIMLIERMLKDFQPLQFARMQDVEEMINQKLKIKQERPNENQNNKI